MYRDRYIAATMPNCRRARAGDGHARSRTWAATRACVARLRCRPVGHRLLARPPGDVDRPAHGEGVRARRVRRPSLPAARGQAPWRAHRPPLPGLPAASRSTLVTYVYGDELGEASGRVRATRELDRPSEYAELAVYRVEVAGAASGTTWSARTSSVDAASAASAGRRRWAARPRAEPTAARRVLPCRTSARRRPLRTLGQIDWCRQTCAPGSWRRRSAHAAGRSGWWQRRVRPGPRRLITGCSSALASSLLVVGSRLRLHPVPRPAARPDPAAQTTVVTTPTALRDGAARRGQPHRRAAVQGAARRPARRARRGGPELLHRAGHLVRGIARALWPTCAAATSAGRLDDHPAVRQERLPDQQRTFTRKIKEIVIALKLDQKYSKDQILEDYLNTIYFGRGAYGIQAACEGVLRQDVEQAHPGAGRGAGRPDPGAVRAGPARHPNEAAARWARCSTAWSSQGWLDAAERAAARFPPTMVAPGGGSPTGPPARRARHPGRRRGRAAP